MMGPSTYKPFKVTNLKRSRRIGLAVADFHDLVTSACSKLNIPKDGAKVLLSDGTEIVDTKFLLLLPDNTLLFVLERGETLSNVTDTIAQFVQLARKITGRADVHEHLQKYLTLNPDVSQRLQMLMSNSTINLSDSRDDDPHWFEGLATRYTSKEVVMKENAARRMRSYLYKTKDDVFKTFDKRKGAPKAKLLAEKLFAKMQASLQKRRHHAWYFARSDRSFRICDHEGSFTCQGRYDRQRCTARHTINPYANLESRISLKTWNFDHVIERSRTIIPCMIKVVRSAAASGTLRINWKYFFSLLFVAEANLKFVHHVCHVLESHTKKTCDPKRCFLQS